LTDCFTTCHQSLLSTDRYAWLSEIILGATLFARPDFAPSTKKHRPAAALFSLRNAKSTKRRIKSCPMPISTQRTGAKLDRHSTFRRYDKLKYATASQLFQTVELLFRSIRCTGRVKGVRKIIKKRFILCYRRPGSAPVNRKQLNKNREPNSSKAIAFKTNQNSVREKRSIRISPLTGI